MNVYSGLGLELSNPIVSQDIPAYADTPAKYVRLQNVYRFRKYDKNGHSDMWVLHVPLSLKTGNINVCVFFRLTHLLMMMYHLQEVWSEKVQLFRSYPIKPTNTKI